MSLKLTWDDKNADVDGFHIYRSDSFIQPYALPAPLATVGPGVFEYLDYTAVRNKPYHYRVGSFKGTEESVSQDRILCNMPYTGPGPQQLLRGTWENGYFGRLSESELFSSAEMLSLTNVPGTINPFSNISWGKFIYKNNILFFPFTPIDAVKIADLYTSGVMYGREDLANWSSYLKTKYGIIPQQKIIRRGDDLFMVRMPKSRANMADTTSVVPDSFRGNEVDFCFAQAFMNTSYPSLSNKTDDFIFDTGFWAPRYWYGCMDAYGDGTTDSFVSRGGDGGFDGIGSYPSSYYINSDGWVKLLWRPVLELIL